MNVLIAASEAYPFSKTGGLGDISGSLPLALSDINTNVSLILPLYKKNYSLLKKSDFYATLSFNIANDIKNVSVVRMEHPKNSNVNVYSIKEDSLFKRNGIYSENGIDYEDNAKRFIVFSKAIVFLIEFLYKKEGYCIDILHINDWQTSLCALYIKDIYDKKEAFKNIKIVFTIHNLTYQGNFKTDIYSLLKRIMDVFCSKTSRVLRFS